MRKLTTEQFIVKAEKVFGSLYDYSKVEYKNVMTKIKIICKTHGEWEVTPDNHTNKKSGCPKCKGFNLTSQEKIKLAHKVHGNQYDYSLITTKNIKNHSTYPIICSEHGVFKQVWNNHYNMGQGCPQCNIAGRKKILPEGVKNSWSKEHTRNYMDKYYENNKDILKIKQKTYNSNNKEKTNKRKRKRWREEPKFKLTSILRTRINECVRKYKISKKDSYRKELGCNISEYIKHLEKQFTDKMNWENHGEYWEIDHIFPLSKGGSFHYTNTQPLTVAENRKKSDKLLI